jgi:ribulose-5-phosphate 4-epimerase/fuculose-1-phosphate aldolase
MSVVGLSETRRSNLDHEQARIELACAFRWAVRYDLHEGVANHFSYAVSDDGTQFLVNPNCRHFSRIRASDLVLLDANDPQTMDRPDTPDPTSWALHGGIHRKVPRARCLMHVHSHYATVLASLADSTMPPIDQNTMRFYGRVAVDDGFDGMGLGDEAERVAGLVGDKPILVMGNHGIMVIGETIAEAFDLLYYFERSCRTLITAMMTGRPLRIAPHEVAQKTMQQWLDYPEGPQMHMREMMAILDEEEPDYRA